MEEAIANSSPMIQTPKTNNGMTRLCKYCRVGLLREESEDMWLDSDGIYDRRPHHGSFQELKECGQSCLCCEKLYTQVIRILKAEGIDEIEVLEFPENRSDFEIARTQKSDGDGNMWMASLGFNSQTSRHEVGISGYTERSGTIDEGNLDEYAEFAEGKIALKSDMKLTRERSISQKSESELSLAADRKAGDT
jgi:hypothetical protein